MVLAHGSDIDLTLWVYILLASGWYFLQFHVFFILFNFLSVCRVFGSNHEKYVCRFPFFMVFLVPPGRLCRFRHPRRRGAFPSLGWIQEAKKNWLLRFLAQPTGFYVFVLITCFSEIKYRRKRPWECMYSLLIHSMLSYQLWWTHFPTGPWPLAQDCEKACRSLLLPLSR